MTKTKRTKTSTRVSRKREAAKRPSAYERKALEAIHQWKNPSLSLADKAWDYANVPLAVAGKLIRKAPGYEKVVKYGKPALDWVLEKKPWVDLSGFSTMVRN